MISCLIDAIKGLKRFPRGIHPPHRKKDSENEPIRMLIPKSELKIPLIQHIGAPCQALVKPREQVSLGRKIADADSPISAPIHASVNGKTGMATMVTLPNGQRAPAIPLTPDQERANVVPVNPGPSTLGRLGCFSISPGGILTHA